MKSYDIIVVGSGLSALFFAYKIAQKDTERQIAIVTKSDTADSNSSYAQGGIACVMDFERDSFAKHIADTIKAGAYVCDETVVSFVVEEAPQRIQDLINLGVVFDQIDGRISLSKEGGHAENRILHHGDTTGAHIVETLIKVLKAYPSISFYENTLVTDLQINPETGVCQGITTYSDQGYQTLLSAQTILATGGVSQVYERATGTSATTGDGIVLAHRAGVKVSDMQFIQFHPTALYPKVEEAVFLISEALRGEGAILRNQRGVAFMEEYDPRGNLAPRDIISQSIYSEFEKGQTDHVLLDCTNIPLNILKKKFPNIYQTCQKAGYTLDRQWVPVAPAVHYTCGGIEVDHQSKTNIPNLLAIGECTQTGLHGANRLASNSLLETIVFADRAATYCLTQLHGTPVVTSITTPKDNPNNPLDVNKLDELKHLIKSTMYQYAGVIRSHKGLLRGQEIMFALKDTITKYLADNAHSTELLELDFLCASALLILEQSIAYPENKGAFYNIDLVC